MLPFLSARLCHACGRPLQNEVVVGSEAGPIQHKRSRVGHLRQEPSKISHRDAYEKTSTSNVGKHIAVCTKPLARRTLRVMSLGCWFANELARCCDYVLLCNRGVSPNGSHFLRTQRRKSECVIIKKNAIEKPNKNVNGRARRKRQRLTANGSI